MSMIGMLRPRRTEAGNCVPFASLTAQSKTQWKTRERRKLVRNELNSGVPLTDSVQERLLDSRIVVLGSEVAEESANRITAQLLLLAAADDSDITLYINSPGGSIPAGFAIYDTMQLIPPDVRTIAMGLVASRWASSCCARARRASDTRCRTRR